MKKKKTKKSAIREVAAKALLGSNKISSKTNHHNKTKTRVEFFKKIISDPITKYALIGLATVLLAVFAYFVKDLPSPKNLTSQENFAVSTQIFDRHGQLLYEIYADENRIPINIDDLPEYVGQASIAIEDKNFYKHFGFDLEGIIRAVKNNLTGDRLEGGSTITQQLVKNALLTPERSFQRKIKEATLSVMTEVIYSKKEILEMYLNYISYGGTAVGIESAAKKYFDKSAKDLSLAEAAMLAGLPQAPSLYSPFGSDPERAKARQAEVLRRMVEEKFITALEAEAAKAETLQFALKKTDIKAPHFVFYVRDQLYAEYGEETVEKGGLRVTTTLDLDLQEAAQASLSAELETLERLKVSNGAAVVTKPNTGEILAMIGSKNYFDTENDGQVNVTIARRQPGSSIKPLVYATTFQEKKLSPGTILLDIPTCFKQPGQADYCPKNYTGDFKGPISVRQSLGNSLNIPAVKAVSTIDIPTFINQAEKMGITGWDDPSHYGPSIALGGGEVRMLDMAQAFGSLANLGIKVPLNPILKIENYKGELIKEYNIDKTLANLKELQSDEYSTKIDDLERVMDAAPAYLASHIMQDNSARTLAFGSNSQLVIKNQIVSAKTGTTNDLKDNWTIGFTPAFLTITWVGNNDNTSMSYVASGVTGAAPIFNDIMSYVLRNQEPLWQEKPESVLKGPVCASGFPPELNEDAC
ncbi:MAG: PBP1A family penicillin-binding protein, partial [Candidatus Pacebacteria bacterium]|nr:PBP1A family penicillin-binding protein [Candidatus Paceibacterota bacterium]